MLVLLEGAAGKSVLLSGVYAGVIFLITLLRYLKLGLLSFKAGMLQPIYAAGLSSPNFSFWQSA